MLECSAHRTGNSNPRRIGGKLAKRARAIFYREHYERVRDDEPGESNISSDYEELDRPESDKGSQHDVKPRFRIRVGQTFQQWRLNFYVSIRVTGCNLLLWVAIIVALFAIFCILCYGAYRRWPTGSHSDPTTSLYAEQFRDMQRSFTRQSDISWKMLNNSLFPRIFSKGPFKKPAVIGMVGPVLQVNSLQERLIHILGHECPTYKTPSDLQEADDMKTHLSNFLNEIRDRGLRCVRIPDIEKIPPEIGPALHGLVDELNARFKDMIYMYSFVLESVPTDMEAERSMVAKLRANWVPKMGIERFQALMTRLCVNVISVP